MAAGDLTTRDTVRDFLQKEDDDTDQDALIDAMITAASRLIKGETAREFAPQANGAARKFVYTPNPRGYLSLAPYDLRTVTQVRIDTDGSSPTVLTTDQYRLYPRNKVDGVWTYLRLDPAAAIGWSKFGERELEVAGDWGFSEVPKDVDHWCVITVATWLRRDVATFETTFGLDEGRLERPLALPRAVLAGLAHWKRAIA